MEHNCACSTCKNACSTKPGWFAPGQVEKVAEFLQIPLEELFKTKLMVDWVEDYTEDDDEFDVFLLSPAIVGGTPGAEFGGDPEGKCVFLTAEGQCGIYSVRPQECSGYIHTQDHDESVENHRAIGRSWFNHQEQIRTLLGRTPEATDYNVLSRFSLFGSFFS